MDAFRFWKFFQRTPKGQNLPVKMEGTGSAVAEMHFDGKIVVDITDGESSKYVEIDTALPFKVIDAMIIHGDSTDSNVAVYNGTDAVTDAMAPSTNNKKIVQATSLDFTKASFSKSDNDLRLEVTTGVYNGRVILNVEFT